MIDHQGVPQVGGVSAGQLVGDLPNHLRRQRAIYNWSSLPDVSVNDYAAFHRIHVPFN